MLTWHTYTVPGHADEQVTISYRACPDGWWPVVWLWCLAGGIPVGLVLATSLLVAGVLDETATSFRLVAGAGTLCAAALLYGLVVRRGQKRVLRVTFDGRNQQVGVLLPADDRWQWYDLDDVILFRLAQQAEDVENGDMVIMETDSAGAVPLVADRLECSGYGGLPALVGRLNAHLDVLRDNRRDLFGPPPPPAVPRRKTPPAPPANKRRRLPDLYHVADQ